MVIVKGLEIILHNSLNNIGGNIAENIVNRHAANVFGHHLPLSAHGNVTKNLVMNVLVHILMAIGINTSNFPTNYVGNGTMDLHTSGNGRMLVKVESAR